HLPVEGEAAQAGAEDQEAAQAAEEAQETPPDPSTAAADLSPAGVEAATDTGDDATSPDAEAAGAAAVVDVHTGDEIQADAVERAGAEQAGAGEEAQEEATGTEAGEEEAAGATEPDEVVEGTAEQRDVDGVPVPEPSLAPEAAEEDAALQAGQQDALEGRVPAERNWITRTIALALEGEGLDAQEVRARRRLAIALVALLALFVCVSAMFWRYLHEPAPMPDLLPLPIGLNYAPHYLFSVYSFDQPVGVAVSPEGDRVYVAESGGERLVKIFDRYGNALRAFAPPGTTPGQRAPVYLAVDTSGWVYVTDRLQRAVFVYDQDGRHLDTILDPGLTLSEYVAEQVGALPEGTELTYNLFERDVRYRLPDGTEHTLPAPERAEWAPLGVRIDSTGSLLVTDVAAAGQCVHEFAGDAILAAAWQQWAPDEIVVGSDGDGDDQFRFPNIAVIDSQHRLYVTDGNNGRVCVWDPGREYLLSFGQGAGGGALSLPRGAAIDGRDRLHVVDAVEQCVKVYDVSGAEPRFLFSFGDWGIGDGQFNYPNDIALDTSGRLYVADRENNRVQAWTY
ncbi:MAG TPA: hypothetical protein ENO23_09695, partial [Alphaproteobacteria bacterium]|nr:hypothetical protein [Alphaproteobacteria bacterium]